MCYIDGKSRDALKDMVNEGIKRWHDALGPNRGIQFRILPSLICGGPEWKPSTVQTKYGPNNMEASLGFDSSHNMGSNSLTFDPYLLLIGSGSPPVTSLDNSIDADITGHLAHELGNS
jgi:hypothetical protein